MNLLRSFLKSRKLAKLSKRLVANGPPTEGIEAFFEAGKIQDEAFEQLLDLIEEQPDLRIVMAHYTRHVAQLYARLRASGAAQWQRGHYVAASSLVFATTLDYLLRNQNTADFRGLAFRLTEYFERAEVGPLVDF